MRNAREVVIMGCSAGGLGIYLGLDQMRDIILQANSSIQVRGASDSGLFLDYTGDSQFRTPRKGMTAFEATVNGILDFSTSMKVRSGFVVDHVLYMCTVCVGLYIKGTLQHVACSTLNWSD
jgi:hypothetical protein